MTERFRKSARTTALVAALGLAAMLAGFAAGFRIAQAAPANQPAAAAIDTFQFKPRDVEIKVGTKVVWTNHDDVTHTVTSGTPEQRTEMFNATLNGKGTTFEFAFAKTGTVTYFCNRHQQMRGEIQVKE
ncbi:MAG: cupredoxin domain-containing protein [Armatimonadota bacterium]